MHNTSSSAPAPQSIPLAVKLVYTAFMAVLVPIYWQHYGPTNFLYFCDVALILTLVGVWTESALLISLSAVGILLPQAFWCVDFVVELCGGRLSGMTSYMFDTSRPLLLRGLSGFHGWLPFLLLWLLRRTGYAAAALPGWAALSAVLCLVSWFLLPGPASVPGDLTPRNINYVHGLSEEKAQTLLPPTAYLITWIAALTALIHVPTHFMLRRWFRPAV